MKQLSTISGLFVGKARIHWPGKAPSAIVKHAVSGPVYAGHTGFETDEQADLSVHGGTEKAIHQYAPEHYTYWAETLPDKAARFHPGGFGENISAPGMTEKDLCVGDILQAGGAKLQISQGRQPCWKLNAHIDDTSMVRRVQKSGRTGWYYRVLEPGLVAVGDSIVLLQRPNPEWTLSRVTAARFAQDFAADDAGALANLAELSPAWRAAFDKKRTADFKEETGKRTHGS